MFAYIIRRLLLIPLTMFGIITLNFAIVQIAPGGPVEQMLAQIKGTAVAATARISGAGGTETAGGAWQPGAEGGDAYRGAQGLPPELIAEIERQFGFDKPAHERFLIMLRNYLTFDLGESYYRDRGVMELVIDKLPVSASLGL